jgi:hypothetical protein
MNKKEGVVENNGWREKGCCLRYPQVILYGDNGVRLICIITRYVHSLFSNGRITGNLLAILNYLVR